MLTTFAHKLCRCKRDVLGSRTLRPILERNVHEQFIRAYPDKQVPNKTKFRDTGSFRQKQILIERTNIRFQSISADTEGIGFIIQYCYWFRDSVREGIHK